MRVRFVFLLGVVALAWIVSAQVRSGTLTGVVTDATQVAIPGAKVTIALPDGTARFETVTDARGQFEFTSVPAGRYRLRVESSGFLADSREVTVAAGRTVTVRVTLQVGAVGEVVGISKMELSRASVSFSPPTPVGPPPEETEEYARIDESGFHNVATSPLSTFSIDVDTASYSNVRRFLRDGELPPKDAVRIEELLNYFSYDYPAPRENMPFSVDSEVVEAPWNQEHRLVRIGLRSTPVAAKDLPPSNLVFLLDVSGSMSSRDKLPLLTRSFRMLTEQLRAEDKVAIVVYAGSSGLVLPPTKGSHKDEILHCLDRLRAGGSTAGAAGIALAYKTARENFVENGSNRVILATDGDFNVGVSSEAELTRLIEKERKGGIFLSVLGFGTGNLKDSKMEQLADHGNGSYAYIDSVLEGRRVLVEQIGGTLLTVAKDVKLQVEFNPAKVDSYRLIGYENRLLANEDFANDKKDAGEMGAGHSVTALYEIVPAKKGDRKRQADDALRYQQPGLTERARGRELLAVKVRYKPPTSETSELSVWPVIDAEAELAEAGEATRWAAAVAQFGMLLRDSEHLGKADFDSTIRLAEHALGKDPRGSRAEFLFLVKAARRLKGI